MEAMRRLMQTFKNTAENAERKIQEYSLRESIAVRERDEIKTLLEKLTSLDRDGLPATRVY